MDKFEEEYAAFEQAQDGDVFTWKAMARHFFTAGEARGRVMGMGDLPEPQAWLITGSKIYQDTATVTERAANLRVIERSDGSSRKVPLYSIDAIRQAAAQPDHIADVTKMVEPAEVCEWTYPGDADLPGEMVSQCGTRSYFNSHGDVQEGFKVCPYCGKPIKVKGE